MSYSVFCANTKCQYHYEVPNGTPYIVTREPCKTGYIQRNIHYHLLCAKNIAAIRICDVCKEAIDIFTSMEKMSEQEEQKKGLKNDRTTQTRSAIKPKG